MNPRINLSRSGVDHVARASQPLHAAVQSTARRIRLRGQFLHRVRRIISQIHEERLRGIGSDVPRSNAWPTPSTNRRCNICPMPASHWWRHPRPAWISRSCCKAPPWGNARGHPRGAHSRSNRQIRAWWDRPAMRRIVVAVAAALQAPFADGDGRITGLLQDRRQGVIVFQRLVELVVSHVRMSLADAQQEWKRATERKPARHNSGRAIARLRRRICPVAAWVQGWLRTPAVWRFF